jgi:hypothetical protein
MFGGESAAELRAYLRFVTKLEAFHSGVLKHWEDAADDGELPPANTL